MFFFFNDTATTEIYPLSLHDALPISARRAPGRSRVPRGLHADPDARPRPRVRRTDRERPPLTPARVPRPRRPAPGARARRQGRRRHRALRRRGCGHRADNSTGERARAPRRHGGILVRPHPCGGAPPVSRSHSPLRRRAAHDRGAQGAHSMKVRRALVSVHDKTGVVEFAGSLAALGVEILSTGGTATLLRKSGVPVRDVSDVTGFPEMLDGRVKTLHPKIHGGILARRDAAADVDALEKHGILPIDLVVVALYPFEATVARSSVTLAEALERIDVGGPAMVRAAAKNHASVGVVTDPSQYPRVLDELRANGGALSEATRARLAQEAFRRTAEYDAAIATYLSEGASAAPSEPSPRTGCAGGAGARTEEFPSRLELNFERAPGLRYGVNPHPAAAVSTPLRGPPPGAAGLTQLHGPELGYNNVLDFSAALALVLEFDEPAAVVVKHTNPCGVALGATVGEAITRAKASDPGSIYGRVVGVDPARATGVVGGLAR